MASALNGPFRTWTQFTKALRDRFEQEDSFLGRLTKLRQTGTVEEYITAFEALAFRTRGLTDTFFKDCFIFGLKEAIKAQVLLHHPSTWVEACQLAHQVTLPSKDFIFTEKKETMEPKGLLPTGISLLQVHGLIQKEKIIVSINPSCQHNFISVNLAKKFQVPVKQIEHTQVDNKDVQIYKDLKLSMDKYVFHGDFYASDMDNMDVVLGYPWMESVGTININVQKKFLKLWYKKKKITLQDISINKHV